MKLYPSQDLWVTRTGRAEDEPGSRKLYQIILDDFNAKKKPGTTQGLLTELRSLGIPSDGSPPPVQVLDETASDWGRRQHLKFESEPDVEVEGTLYLPNSAGRKPAVLAVADKPSVSPGSSIRLQT